MADDGALQSLIDRSDIIEVALRYASAVDRQDWDSLRETLASDVEWSYAGRVDRIVGSDAVVSMMRESLSPLDRTQHFNTNHQVMLRGDVAEHTRLLLGHTCSRARPLSRLGPIRRRASSRSYRVGVSATHCHRDLAQR